MSPTITKADLARRDRRDQQPKREAGELLAIFVPGALQNTLNATGWHWQKRRRWAADWKERTALAILEARYQPALGVTRATPKHVSFTLHVARLWDDDALPGGCKPIRDALVPTVIHSDGPTSGHVFTYHQVKDGKRGVTVRVRLQRGSGPQRSKSAGGATERTEG